MLHLKTSILPFVSLKYDLFSRVQNYEIVTGIRKKMRHFEPQTVTRNWCRYLFKNKRLCKDLLWNLYISTKIKAVWADSREQDIWWLHSCKKPCNYWNDPDRLFYILSTSADVKKHTFLIRFDCVQFEVRCKHFLVINRKLCYMKWKRKT